MNRKLVKYLLLINPGESFEDPLETVTGCIDVQSSTQNHPNDPIILDLLQARLDSFSQAWTQLHAEKLSHITAETIQIITSMCVITNLFVEFIHSQSIRSQNLRKTTDALWQKVCRHISENPKWIQCCLDVLSPIVLSLRPPFNRKSITVKALSRISTELLPLLMHQRELEQNGTALEFDTMELDDQFTSFQANCRHEVDMVSKLNRSDTGCPMFEDNDSIRMACTIQFSFLNIFLSSSDNVTLGEHMNHYVGTWDSSDILTGWYYLVEFMRTQPNTSRADACILIELFGEQCLESYALERCEASISACIELMTCFVHLWTVREDDELSDSTSDLYTWFTEILIGKRVGTSKTLVRLAELLEQVLTVDPTFLRESQLPSPRTSLFKILQESELTVKYHISALIPRIFGGFVLKEHDAIFDDILESLPRDREWDEGIALRLFLLAKLASKWHTLLRRSIYHIFETPGQVPSSAPYASACLRSLSKALGLVDAREIFKIFSPQIIYTWMETQSPLELPFSVFGYSTLRDLLVDIQDEVVAQVVMRVKEEEVHEISACLDTPFHLLLVRSFYKAEAYSIARDISMPPSQDPKVRGSESGIKKLLGTEKFLSLAEQHFPGIVGVMFRSMDQTEQVERAFAKRPHFQPALAILKSICGRSSSAALLPTGQQPSFRARYLIDELEFLCRRTGYELETMWTPALVSFVARELISSIHPALGSLHACAVIRKLRVLVCIAGSIVLEDYPLELLLHCLRPFLTDFHCSADAIGIFWYLIDSGREHLFYSPSFLAGLAVPTLASLKAFLSSRQESTTQETDFRAAMSKAQNFHQWFSNFLDEYRAPALNDEEQASLRKIIQSAQKICLSGNASKGTFEGELLVSLLQDKISGRNLLSSATSELVLTQLCQDFQKPDSFHDDVLGDDKAASSNTIGLWGCLENHALGPGFRLWAARALGRAYAATGIISESLLREQRVVFFSKTTDEIPETSKISIIRALCDTLFSNDRQSVGLAERSLQAITDGLIKQSGLEECEEAIPVSLMKALVWAPYNCPGMTLKESETPLITQDIHWVPTVPFLEFAKEFSLTLSFRAKSDPVVGALQPILFAVPALAAQLLPYMLHDVLLQEHGRNQKTQQAVSVMFREAFHNVQKSTLPHIRLIIYCILYLRHQPIPGESTMDERDNWLDIDYTKASFAATKCGMYKTALLFVEIHFSRIAAASRRSSALKFDEPTELLHTIFSNIDDPDMFYGVQHEPSIDSILEKLGLESSGLKNLAFQSANYDTDMKMDRSAEERDALGIVKALNSTNLQGIANIMFHAPGKSEKRVEAFDSMISTALHLQQWDIPMPDTTSPIGSIFKALQGLNMYDDKTQVLQVLDDCFLNMLNLLSEDNQSLSSFRDIMRVLGILSEFDEIISSKSYSQVEETWKRVLNRAPWLKFER